MDPFSIASGIAGLISLADIVFTRTYRYVRQVKNAETDIAKLATEVGDLAGLLHRLYLVLSELEKETSETNFQLKHINACRETLRFIEKKLDTSDHSATLGKGVESTFRKLKWPFSATETKERLIEIERHKAVINMALSADSLTSVLRILSRQTQLESGLRELTNKIERKWAEENQISLTKERRTILAFFEKVDPESHHKTNLKLRHPLTGLWLTEGTVFQSWLHTPESKLWLSGIPGAGKTIMAAATIEETMKESSATHAVAYFYCDYKDQKRQDPLNMLASIAAQLARQNEGAFKELQRTYKKMHPDNGSHLSLGIEIVQRLIGHLLACFGDVSFIIDGLDECGENISTATQCILDLAANKHLRLLLLSRDISEINGCVKGKFDHLDIAAQSEDLRIYVGAEIDLRLRKYGRGQLRVGSSELKEHIMTTLINGSGGMFRWVACQLDYLCDLPTDAKKRKALRSLPPTLHATYERILETVSQSGPEAESLVRSTLNWLVYREDADTLPSGALCHALSVEDGDRELDPEAIVEEETILQHCNCLVRKNATYGRLELAHFSVKEFLAQIPAEGSPFSSFSQEPTHVQVHAVLARTCLTYLNLTVFRNVIIDNLEEWEAQNEEFPFRHYAVINWYKHANRIHSDDGTFHSMKELFGSESTVALLSWARDHALHTGTEFGVEESRFAKATTMICGGGVSPLKLAAALPSFQLCQWLLSEGANVNSTSHLGTAIHFCLIGLGILHDQVFYDSDDFDDFDDSDDSDDSFLSGNRLDETCSILELLVANGADLSLPYRRNKYRVSCAKLGMRSRDCAEDKRQILKTIIASGRLHAERCRLPEFCRELILYLEAETEEHPAEIWEQLMEEVAGSGADFEAALGITPRSGQSLVLHSTAIVVGKEVPCFTNNAEALLPLLVQTIRYDQADTLEKLLHRERLHVPSVRTLEGEALIHVAARYKAIHSTKVLLLRGAEVNSVSKEGFTPLHLALQDDCQRLDCFQLLLEAGASLSMTEKVSGRNAWHIATNYNDIGLLHLLTSKDDNLEASLTTVNDQGLTPLFHAAKDRNTVAIEYLLRTSPVRHDLCPDGKGLVHYIIAINSLKLLQLLKSHGYHLDQLTSSGENALHLIPDGVDPEIIHFLLENGIEPDLPSNTGMSPLHYLVQSESAVGEQTFALLATRKAVSQVTEAGKTALHYAVELGEKVHLRYVDYERAHGRKLCIEWLFQSGADPKIRDNTGRSFIGHFLWSISNHRIFPLTMVVELLLTVIISHVDDLSLLDEVLVCAEVKTSLLNWCLEHSEETLARSLLAKGASVNALSRITKDTSWSALEVACYYGSSEDLFKQIISASTRLGMHDNRGDYITHIACSRGSKAKVHHLEQLQKAGANINIQQANSEHRSPLMLSCRHRNIGFVDYLIAHGADVKARNKGGCTASLEATFSGFVQGLELLLHTDVDWQQTMDVVSHSSKGYFRQWNALHIAALLPDITTIKWLLDRSLVADIDCFNGSGLSALHLASYYGVKSEMIVEALIQSGAQVDKPSSQGLRPIHYAISAGKQHVVESLLRHGCSLGTDTSGLTITSHALKSGNENIFALIRKQTSQSRQPELGGLHANEPAVRNSITHPQDLRQLLVAIYQDDLHLCKALVESGVSIHHPISTSNCQGCLPLLHALALQRYKIASYLLAEGAATIGQYCSGDLRGYTAVHLASRASAPLDILRPLLLQDAEADWFAFKSTVSPMHIAVASGNDAALRVLLDHSQVAKLAKESNFLTVDRNSKTMPEPGRALNSVHDRGEKTLCPLLSLCDYAIQRSKLKWEWMLFKPENNLKGMANMALTTRWFSTGSNLHLAAFTNNLSAVEILLTHGASIDPQDDNKRTPLHIAALQNHIDLTSFLLQHGANPFARDYDGRTPATLAVCHKSLATLELFHKRQLTLKQIDWYRNSMIFHAATNSAQAMSYLLFKGYNPYTSSHSGVVNAVQAGLFTSGRIPAMASLLLNWDLNFDLCPGLISWTNWAGVNRPQILVMLLTRLPKTYIAREINLNTSKLVLGTPLCQAAMGGQIDIMNLLVNAGADLEVYIDSQGTPLIAACNHGRLSSVKFLIRAGATMFGTKGGKACSAIEAAQDFPAIVHWLLVDRHTEQHKIESPGNSESVQECKQWDGVKTAEAIVTGLYQPFTRFSMRDRLKELAYIRNDLRGKVVRVVEYCT